MIRHLLLVTAALAFSVVTFASECFDPQFAQGWSYDSDKSVLSGESFKTTYEVKTFGSCSELTWAQAVGFQSFFGSQVCSGDKVVVYDGFDRVTQVCTIDSIVKSAK